MFGSSLTPHIVLARLIRTGVNAGKDDKRTAIGKPTNIPNLSHVLFAGTAATTARVVYIVTDANA